MSGIAARTMRTAPLLFAGGLLLSVFGLLWLRIPDSHVWQLGLSIVLGLAIVVGGLMFGVTAIRRARPAVDFCGAWLGAVLLAVWVAVYEALRAAAGRIEPGAMQRAGYWNSQMSPHWRRILTFERLMLWQTDAVVILAWYAIPLLLLPLVMESVVRGPRMLRGAMRVWLRWQYWMTGIAMIFLCRWGTNALVVWQPASSIRGELVSVVLRMGAVWMLWVVGMCLLLGVTGWLLARVEARRQAGLEPVQNGG